MPCGEPVEIEQEDESTAWWRTVWEWEWLTRKLTIQRIGLGLTLIFKSLLAMRCGCMVLKAEEKLMKRIRTDEPVFFQDEYMPCAKECCVFGASVVLVCKLQLFDLPAALKFEIMCQSLFFFRTWWQMKIPLWLTTTHRSSKQTWMGNSKTGKPWSWSPSLRRSVLFFVLFLLGGGGGGGDVNFCTQHRKC